MTAFFSPDVSSRATAVPPSFSADSLALCRSDADDEQRGGRSILVDELLGSARGIAFEPLPVERSADRLLRAPSDAEARPVLAGDRQHQRIIPRRPAVGETNLHCGLSLKGERSRSPLGCKSRPWQSSDAPGRLSRAREVR